MISADIILRGTAASLTLVSTDYKTANLPPRFGAFVESVADSADTEVDGAEYTVNGAKGAKNVALTLKKQYMT